MPMHSRKKLQKKETLTPIPKKYLEYRASLMAQLVKNLPAMWDTWIQSLGWEDPPEKGKATHSVRGSTLTKTAHPDQTP